MTEHDALVDIIKTNLEYCMIIAERKNTFDYPSCYSCKHRKKDECYYHSVADKILEFVSQIKKEVRRRKVYV